MISLEQARRTVLSAVNVLPTTTVKLEEALGHVASAPVKSAEAVPPFANTAMDGYAVRAEDTAQAPVVLEVISETLAAGAIAAGRVGPRQAIRIMTGAPIPDGADSVVMVEDTEQQGDGGVLIQTRATPGQHVRAAGSDLYPGQTVIEAGTELSPAHLGVLASVGATSVEVFRRPRVGVLSTGDELVREPRPLKPGEIRDSNRASLMALLEQCGCIGVDLGIRRDVPEEIEKALLDAASACDALLTTGGVSVGDFDYTKAVLDRLSGGTMSWMQIAIKPAKPFAFGTIGRMSVFGLPGNPVSSLVSFECLARPALRKMAGHESLDRPTIKAVADEPLPRHPDGKLHFLRVHAEPGEDGRLHVTSAGGQGSHQLLGMASANALAMIPDGDGTVEGGDVEVLLLGSPL